MGEDKALLPFGGFKTLTQFQFHKLSKLFKNVYISCKDKSKFDFKADFIEDMQTEEIYAPTIGFVSAFEHLKCESFFAMSVDTPFITEHIIKKIIEVDTLESSADAVIASSSSGMHPLCGVYHSSLKNEFYNMLKSGEHRLSRLLKGSETIFVDFSEDDSFLNMNNPQEYEQALRQMSE